MPKTCPYHGSPQPCRDCLANRMGQFAHYRPRPGCCPYHNNEHPCLDCFDKNMGEFAHSPASAGSVPAYVPPHRRPIHFRQSRKDTCGIACCGMVGANLNCTRRFTLDDLEQYMMEKGIYMRGQQSLFHALDQPLEWLGLRCQMRQGVRPTDIADIVRDGSVVIMEALGHVLVIFSANADGTLIIGDPAMSRVEMSVNVNDYRLKGTGRIWEIRK